jgi:hypothetical protein
MRFATLVLGLSLALPMLAQDPLSIQDRADLNEARFKAAEAALALERLRPMIRQIQEAHALSQSTLANLHALEQALSERYTRGEKILNSDLVWVEKPPAKPSEKESPK